MDHSLNTVGAAIKALEDVVKPSIDENDPLANEQLKLVVEYMRFLADHLPDLHARNLLELSFALDLAKDFIALGAEGADSELFQILTDAVPLANAVLVDPFAREADLTGMTSRLRAICREYIRDVGERSSSLTNEVERAVIYRASESNGFYRSWYAALGFDPNADELQPISEIIDALLVSAKKHRD